MNPYNDRDYKTAVAALKRHPQTCWHDDCDNPATTIDHVPALAHHHHRRGSGCCEYLPACRPHNCGDGARIRNQRSATGYNWP